MMSKLYAVAKVVGVVVLVACALLTGQGGQYLGMSSALREAEE